MTSVGLSWLEPRLTLNRGCKTGEYRSEEGTDHITVISCVTGTARSPTLSALMESLRMKS